MLMRSFYNGDEDRYLFIDDDDVVDVDDDV